MSKDYPSYGKLKRPLALKVLFRRLPHATRIGMVLTFLLLSIPVICAIAVMYIADIRSDLAEVTGREVPLAEEASSVAIGGIGQSVLFERAIRQGIDARRGPAYQETYETTKTAYFGITIELKATIASAKAQAKQLVLDTTNEITRGEALLLHDLLQEMEEDASAFETTAAEVFQLLENGQITAAKNLAETATPRNLKLRAQIEQIMGDVKGFTSAAVAEAAAREREALLTLGSVLVIVVLVGAGAGIYSLRALGTDLLRREIRETHLHQRASVDKLTGLPNRSHFRSLTGKALQSAKRSGEQMALLFIDLDGFKQVNDTHGHAAGDTVLQEIALRLTRSVRESDIVCRLGGDEFAVSLTETETREDARIAARRIIDFLAVPYYVEDRMVELGASIGIAMSAEDANDIDTLLRRADQAMYAAKESGGNSVLMFSELIEDAAHDSAIIPFAKSS
ncbi:MAG: diguanylate cyclase domain-containing protein [Alphaproteobacteria bacterium]